MPRRRRATALDLRLLCGRHVAFFDASFEVETLDAVRRRPHEARRGPDRRAQVDEAAAAAKVEGAEKVDAVSEKLGVDAPLVSMEALDEAAALTKGKVAEGGAATDAAVKAAVGPAQ